MYISFKKVVRAHFICQEPNELNVWINMDNLQYTFIFKAQKTKMQIKFLKYILLAKCGYLNPSSLEPRVQSAF